MKHEQLAALTLAQAKNYAVQVQEAIVQLGLSLRRTAPAMQSEYTESMQQMIEGLERVYWQSKTLEKQVHARLVQEQSDALKSKEVAHGP